MDFENVLTRRSSVRSYTDRMPDAETIEKIINAGLLSPIVRWHNFHITVVTNKEAIKIAEDNANVYMKSKSYRKYMYDAPVWIILSGIRHKDDDPVKQEKKNNNLMWNAGSIIENMELQAVAMGLACCGMNSTITAMSDKPDVRKAVGIPDGYDALASLIVGYSDEFVAEREVNKDLIPVTFLS